MADFGHAKASFLREFLELPNSTPCHDTFSRVFRLIKPASFQHLFDKYRARKGNAPINFAALRRIALNIIKTNTDKGSSRLKLKRAGLKRAGWNNDFLRSLLNDF